MTVTFSKDPVDGKRPGDVFIRYESGQEITYRVVRVAGNVVTTESVYGREVWAYCVPGYETR